jgi:steroid delta-isomerase-like uncharacterized protein
MKSTKNVIKSNRALIETYFYEVWNKGDLTKLTSIIDPSYVNHNPSTEAPISGPEGLKPIILAMRSGIPDLHYEILETIITADRVAARVQVTGTHLGILFGIPPTGRRFNIEQINVERVKSGKIMEHWRVTDELKMMRQLGLVQ